MLERLRSLTHSRHNNQESLGKTPPEVKATLDLAKKTSEAVFLTFGLSKDPLKIGKGGNALLELSIQEEFANPELLDPNLVESPGIKKRVDLEIEKRKNILYQKLGVYKKKNSPTEELNDKVKAVAKRLISAWQENSGAGTLDPLGFCQLESQELRNTIYENSLSDFYSYKPDLLSSLKKNGKTKLGLGITAAAIIGGGFIASRAPNQEQIVDKPGSSISEIKQKPKPVPLPKRDETYKPEITEKLIWASLILYMQKNQIDPQFLKGAQIAWGKEVRLTSSDGRITIYNFPDPKLATAEQEVDQEHLLSTMIFLVRKEGDVWASLGHNNQGYKWVLINPNYVNSLDLQINTPVNATSVSGNSKN